MARTLTPKDAYALMNQLVKQATGQTSIVVTDLSSFVSAGELVMATGTENVLNSLSILINRTIVSSRPYKARLDLMEETNGEAYSGRLRKISFYSKNAKPSGAYNTDLFTNFAEGYTNGQNTQADPHSTKSMWEISNPIPLEMSFGGMSTWQDCATIYEDQLKIAFTGPEQFNAFISNYLVEHNNDIESQREAWNRIALLNKIGSVYDMSSVMPGSVVNLTDGFNLKFGTQYTRDELLSDHLKSFLAYFVAEFKKYSNFMEERSLNYHWSPAKQVGGVDYYLLRHTPKSEQHAYLYQPLFIDAESLVLPQIFNPEGLKIKNYQPVSYWQSESNRPSVNVTPAVTNTSTGVQEAGTPVNLPYVVGLITDREGLMTNWGVEASRTTPLEARKNFRNVWTTFLKNVMTDNTMNCVLFIM